MNTFYLRKIIRETHLTVYIFVVRNSNYIISEDKNYKLNTKVIDLDNNPSDHKPIKANIIKTNIYEQNFGRS